MILEDLKNPIDSEKEDPQDCLIIEDNTVYEIDLDCMKSKLPRNKLTGHKNN